MRELFVLKFVVLLQAAIIAFLVVPFGTEAKHPLTLQTGKLELNDVNGTVRAEISAELEQTLCKMTDAKGKTRVLLRENDSGFVTMKFTERNNNEVGLTLFSGTKRSYLELRDPKTGKKLYVHASEEGLGFGKLDQFDQVIPWPL